MSPMVWQYAGIILSVILIIWFWYSVFYTSNPNYTYINIIFTIGMFIAIGLVVFGIVQNTR